MSKRINPETEAMIEEMVNWANQGNDVIPLFFQPRRGGISNTVSAAIRVAKARGLLVQNGVDGTGKPRYGAPIKTATHAGTQSIN